MYNIIPLILILISFSIVIVIVVRKFSVLSSLDIESIPAEKEARFKEQIISNRLKRNILKLNFNLIKVSKFSGQKISAWSKLLYDKLNQIKKDYDIKESVKDDNKGEKIEKIFKEIEELRKTNNTKDIESKLIEIIGLNAKEIKAFKMLGDYYFENKNYEDAKQTMGHILKLLSDSENLEELAEVHFNLALVSKAVNDLDEALKNIQTALEFKQNNPKYLDTMLEICILKKDKVLAFNACENLEKVNPENTKLADFKEKISKL